MRSGVNFCSRKNTRATCCVIVEAPWRMPPVTSATAARAMPFGSMPLCSRKRASSTAITASCISLGIFSIGTNWRRSAPKVAISTPSAENTCSGSLGR